MANIFRELMEAAERSEKQTRIRQSGSTRDGGNEKIRSGQSYLYKLRGMESEVIEIRFKRNVRGAPLRRALDETLRRYPYFCTRLLEQDGDFYIVQNDVSPVVRRTRAFVRLGGIECGYHLIDVTYFGCSVYVSFHHALCDGRGIKPFVETLLWYYCAFAYGRREPVEGVRLAGEPLLEGETADPFMQPYAYDGSKKFVEFSRDAFALPLPDAQADAADYRYEVVIPHGSFMEVCHRENATPVILLSLLMSAAIAALHPDFDKPIHANIATDMREALGCPNTFKNCVRSMILPYDRDSGRLPLREQATRYRAILNAQRDPDYCRREANAMLALFDKLDEQPSYKEKQALMSFFEGMLLHTYVVSYLGRFILGDNAGCIDTIHLYNSGTTGLGINMIDCGESFVLDFKQSFRSDSYVSAFLAEAERVGLRCRASGAIAFSTPTDKLIRRKKTENG